MANPQIENGHIKIANEIWDALCKIRIPGEQMQILLVIIRKTYGYHKKIDGISLSQFSKITGISRRNCIRAINELSKKRVIIIIKKDNTQWNMYEFNKDFEKWIPLSKKTPLLSKKTPPNCCQKRHEGGVKKDMRSMSKKTPTKDNSTKDNNTKEKILSFSKDDPSLKSFSKNTSVVKKEPVVEENNYPFTSVVEEEDTIVDELGIDKNKNKSKSAILAPTTKLIISEIINYLNEKIDKKYKVTSKKTISLISARVKEGYSVEDFKIVIDNKIYAYNKNKFDLMYLRPITLFGEKFESYLNERVSLVDKYPVLTKQLINYYKKNFLNYPQTKKVNSSIQQIFMIASKNLMDIFNDKKYEPIKISKIFWNALKFAKLYNNFKLDWIKTTWLFDEVIPKYLKRNCVKSVRNRVSAPLN